MRARAQRQESSARLHKLSVWRRVLSETFSNWIAHDAPTQSAALGFYTLFSLAPVLIVVTSTAGHFFGAEEVRQRVVAEFQALVGREAAYAVGEVLKGSPSEAAGLGGAIGILALVFGATAFFLQLQEALNRIWDVQPRPGQWLRSLLAKRLLSLALVLAMGFLLLVSLALSAAINALQDYVGGHYALTAGLLEGLNALFSFAVFTILFGMIFRILPDVDIPWRDVWFGATATSALFCLGKWLIGLYLGRPAVSSPYGAAGALVLVTLWVYYASFILLFGAEFTRVFSRTMFDSHRHASVGAKRVRLVQREIRDNSR